MGLQLGLESLNNSPAAVVPFSVESLLDMGDQRLAIESLMAQLDTYYSAAVNAMTIRKSIKKFGKTQSTAFLVGQEGLNFAMSFSMEGFWQKTKDFLWKIWSKIKEWWGRFWGMFFSIENKLSTFVSDCGSSSRRLAANVEFDAIDYDKVVKASTGNLLTDAIKALKEASEKTDKQILDDIITLARGNDTTQHGSTVKVGIAADTIHYRLTTLPDVKKIANALLEDVIRKHRNTKRDIDDYTKKILDKIKNMKITTNAAMTSGTSGNIYGGGGAPSRSANDDTTAEEQDIAVKIIRNAAKINNQTVAWCLNAATSIAVKLMAHTRLVNK